MVQNSLKNNNKFIYRILIIFYKVILDSIRKSLEDIIFNHA